MVRKLLVKQKGKGNEERSLGKAFKLSKKYCERRDAQLKRRTAEEQAEAVLLRKEEDRLREEVEEKLELLVYQS